MVRWSSNASATEIGESPLLPRTHVQSYDAAVARGRRLGSNVEWLNLKK
jgi:hypothetical protein